MNHESNSNNYKKIIFGNKHQTSNDNIFVNEYTFDSPLWKQLTDEPEILKKGPVVYNDKDDKGKK